MGFNHLTHRTLSLFMLLAILLPCVAIASIETLEKKLNSIYISQHLVRDESTAPLLFRVIVREKKSPQSLEQFLNVLWLGPTDAAKAQKSLVTYKVGKTLGGNKVIGKNKANGMDCLKLREIESSYEINQCWKIGTKAALVLSFTSDFPDSKLKSQVTSLLKAEDIR